MAELDYGLDYGPEFWQMLNESARLLSQNRPGEALKKLLPLYAQAPEHPDVLINLSGAYVLQRKWNRAVQLLSEAVRLHPHNAMLWTNLGAAQLGRLETAGPRQQDKAIHAYQRALQANPEAPNVHYHLGLIYKERGELSRAAAFFQRALEVNPADRDARYWLDRLTSLIMEETRAKRRGQEEDKQDADDTPNDDDNDGGKA
jgi:tetratricopeptide (TPR) repeat protein